MGEREEIVQKYLGDMVSVERYIYEAAEQQVERGRFEKFPDAKALVQLIKDTTGQHLQGLEQAIQQFGAGEPSKGVKETVAGAIGSVIDVVQSLRSEEESKMLRDHYTALSLTKISYIALHTTSLVLQQTSVADQALRNMGELNPLLRELETAIIAVTADEIRQDVSDADFNAASDAVRNVQEAA
jgi:hypothetical protein